MVQRITTAVVVADGLETRYLRCGAGRTVVLVARDNRLAIELAASCRVIAPEVPPGMGADSFVLWLRSVFDGLGITAAAIVTTPEFAEAARIFASEEPERVNGVVGAGEAIERFIG
jgi:hypothetical protein